MWFNSLEFLSFFAVVLLGHRLCDQIPQAFRLSVRVIFLLTASYVFYAAWRPEFLILIVGSTVVDYIAGRMMATAEDAKKKRILTVSIVVNLGILALFKYAKFAYESVTSLLNAAGLSVTEWQDSWDFALPVGISFYTFQSMSYTIDVYRGRLKPETNFLRFALFVAYFPQLVAGPIEKARHLLAELKGQDKSRAIDPPAALYQIAYGLFKKAVIADGVAAYIDPIFTHPGNYSSGTLAVAAVLFSVQIYCDFSGYTDIAIGVSKLLGIRLSLNFAYPYFSRNITEFWRTWHISLSSWLKEYLYFSLGGNRQPRRTQFNLMATMLLGGLWHGESWNFVVWGGLHGLYLVIHKWFMKLTGATPTSQRSVRPRPGRFP